MKDCEYETVNCDEDLEDDNNFSWKYFLRQLLVSSVVWVSFLTYGLGFGAPTVFIPKIRKENKDAIDESMQSWLTSMTYITATPWVVILSVAASYLGRKYPYAFTCISMLISSIVLYCSNTVVEIIVSLVLLGVVAAANTTVAYIVTAEYTSPKYRGMFLTFKSATFCWGVWISNVIGTFTDWKYIALVMMILSIYPIIVIFIWPESPYFLASKSKFDKCIRSHRWLKGKKSEKELAKLLSMRNEATETTKFFKVVLNKRFYKAFLLTVCLFALYTFSGKHVCTLYSIDIIKKLTSSESTAYTGMLILDGVTVFSMYVGSMLSKVLRRRVLFISSVSIGIVSLFILSVHVYLIHVSILQENGYITLVLLSIYSIGIGSGPVLMSSTLASELMPLQFKFFAVCSVSIFDKIFAGTAIKLSPMLIKKFGLHVAFFTFGFGSTICIILIYLYMPETKDKTLFEISNEIQGDNKKTSQTRSVLINKGVPTVMY